MGDCCSEWKCGEASDQYINKNEYNPYNSGEKHPTRDTILPQCPFSHALPVRFLNGYKLSPGEKEAEEPCITSRIMSMEGACLKKHEEQEDNMPQCD